MGPLFCTGAQLLITGFHGMAEVTWHNPPLVGDDFTCPEQEHDADVNPGSAT
jgi:hypothetical protein